jgi:hypothetical protein
MVETLFFSATLPTYESTRRHSSDEYRAEDGDRMFLHNVGINQPANLQGAITQKNNTVILTAVRISDLRKTSAQAHRSINTIHYPDRNTDMTQEF